ncbi:MAG: sigma-54-dependent Fis family transcriptional regulator [Syntrophothermaceae bacterium]|jgi:PAS domain S-box-containing protein
MKGSEQVPENLFSHWKDFVTFGKGPYTGLQREIFESWQRARETGVDPYRHIIDPGAPGIGKLTDGQAELLTTIYPVMEATYAALRGSGFRVLLADVDGWIIGSIPHADTALYHSWSEKELGTNGIGTSIATGRPIQVKGPEHYCHELHEFTTSATPIFNRKNRLVGALALIGLWSEDHSHVLSMLTKAASKATDELKIQEKNRQLTTCNQRLTNIFNTMSDGVLIITADGTIEIVNPAVEGILGKTTDELSGTHLTDILGDKIPFTVRMLREGKPYDQIEVLIDSPHGRIHCLASAQPSHDENGNITGGIIVVQSMNKVHNLVNYFSGRRAQFTFDKIIGRSVKLLEAIAIARIASRNTSNVLLQGESGTGKEIFAQAIHNEGSRAPGPFIAINCGAIPRELVGSELFGYGDGAFTGAKRGGKPGKFEVANGGTLFLDEIGDMPLEAQVVLLRVLQNKCVTRIGDSKEIPVDVRIICATNKDLLQEVEKGNFREDLYYRINVISIIIPPLRDRTEDIPLLADHCLIRLDSTGRSFTDLMEPEVRACLQKYPWPGNVRELQNILERLVLLAGDGRVRMADLPPEVRAFSGASDTREAGDVNNAAAPVSGFEQQPHKQGIEQMVAEEESARIITLLRQNQGNVSQTARDMGFSRVTLYRKMQRYGISRGDI